MPLQKIIISKQAKLYLWNITETTAELLSLFSGELPLAYERYRFIEHQQQFLAKKLLLEYLNINHQIQYLDTGKPVLSDKKYISISHSRNWVAVALSPQEIGIDMETANPKLKRIASKFVNPYEQAIFDIENLTDLQYLWTAKESIYKLAGQTGLRFKEDIIIKDFDRQKQTAQAMLLEKKPIKIFYNNVDKAFVVARSFYDI